MPTTITLKNIPDDVYERLRESAAVNKRSLNNEAIVCLESALLPGHLPPAERLERIRADTSAAGCAAEGQVQGV